VLDGRAGKKVRLREALTRVQILIVLILVLGLSLLLLLDDRLLAPRRWRRRPFAEVGALLLLIR
jgi:hypothetical protein